jgi:hypothetical protein
MAFQTPITIATTLDRIRDREYVLPAIQREFVWRPDQICRLFDSLMRGYPIGSFLFWKVSPENVREFVFYGFLKDYHQKDAFHLPEVDLPPGPVTAILDGQQRLTSLNIGLRGSHAEKIPYMHYASPWAYPERFLYLNVAGEATDNEMGMEYDFRFLTPERARESTVEGVHWFKVADILSFGDATDIFEYVLQHDLATNKSAFKALNRLHAVAKSEPVINYFEETAQDLDKVLNIFIRVNSGGTVLSYSDLLLSIATAQWKELDAREAVHGLVDELNETGNGFGFNKDIVLKAGLMLTDIQSVAFRVTNFNTENMTALEDNWPRITNALRVAVRLLADFGFSGTTLRADSVLIPLAYYLNKIDAGEHYLNSQLHAEDRDRVRGWVVRSLVKSGIWGSGLDTLLIALRTAIRESVQPGFPLAALETAMVSRAKTLKFEEVEIEDLAGMTFSDRRVFPVLSLLYPGMNFKNEFHVDHIFPRAMFTRRALLEAGLNEVQIESINDKVNRLPNLQLLEGPINTSKSAKPPMSWLREYLSDESARDSYRARHDLGDVPEALVGFEDFYEARKERIVGRLRQMLGVSSIDGDALHRANVAEV